MLAMVGMRASCQPMPVLIMVAPAVFHLSGQCHHLFPGTASRHQIQHGEPVNNDKIPSHPLPDPADDLQGQSDPVFEREPPQRSVRRLVAGAINWLIR